jgi:WD40 repeat protein
VTAATVSPDRKFLAVGFTHEHTHPGALRGGEAVRLYDLTSGNESARLPGHTKGVWDLQFAPDGKTLYSAGADGTVRAWQLK